MIIKILNFIKYAIFSNFSKNVKTLILGSGFSYLLAFAFMPIVTRVYSESEIGIYQSLLAIIGIIGSFINFRLDLALPTIKENREMFQVFQLSFLVGTLGIIPFTILFYFMQANHLFGFQEYPFWAPILLFCMTILNTLYTSLQGALFKLKYYGHAAKGQFLNMFLRGGFQIIFNFTNFGSFGLISGEGIARIGSSFYISYKTGLLKRLNLFETGVNTHLINFKKYKNYILFITPSSFLTAITASSTVPAFLALYSSNISGQIALALTVSIIPITIIGKSASDVFIGYISTAYHNNNSKELLKMFLNTLLVTLTASLVIHITLALSSEFLFPIVFGSKWLLAGEFCKYLAIGNIFFLPVMVLEKVLFTYKKEKVKLIFDGLMASGLIFIFIIARAENWAPISLIQVFMVLRLVISIIEIFFLYLITKKITSKLGN